MRLLLRTVFAIAALWGAAFFVYLLSMYMPADDADLRADALIVLTGGNARVERGFELLSEESSSVLFISGVGANVTLPEMLAAHTSDPVRRTIVREQPQIVFDYDAASTQGNASEAAAFVRRRGYGTIRLITGHYHMPRSMVEFRAALPGVTILREPVVPDSFARTTWWQDPPSRRLIWQEFHKYLAARGRVLLDRVS